MEGLYFIIILILVVGFVYLIGCISFIFSTISILVEWIKTKPIKKFFCIHEYELVRMHYTHDYNICEMKCVHCGKLHRLNTTSDFIRQYIAQQDLYE